MTIVDVAGWLNRTLESPPTSPATLARQVRRLPLDAVREAVAAQLRSPICRTSMQCAVMREILHITGVSDSAAICDTLARIAIDGELPGPHRVTAFSAFETVGNPFELAPRLAQHVDALQQVMFLRLAMSLGDAPSPGRFVADTVGSLPEGLPRRPLVEAFSNIRESQGLGFVQTFGMLLREGGLNEDPEAMRCILEAAACSNEPEAVDLLVFLRDQASDPAQRRLIQRAVMQTGTRVADGRLGERVPSPPPKAGAWGEAYGLLGSTDGAGAVILMAVLPDERGTVTMANVVIRLLGDVRDGFVRPHMAPEELEQVVDQLTGASSLTRVPIAVLAEYAAAAEARTEAMDLPLPHDALPALRLMRPYAVEGGDWSPVAAKRPVPADVESLLATEEYDAWFFDLGDLSAAGLVPGPGLMRDKGRAALERLEATGIGDRLRAMLSHQVRLCLLRDDVVDAKLLGACLKQLDRGLAKSDVARLMLARGATVEPTVRQAATGAALLGDEGLREEIRLQLLNDRATGDEAPKNQALAVLDLATALAVAQRPLQIGMLSEEVPRDELLLRTAVVVARSAAESMYAAADPRAVDARAAVEAVWPTVSRYYRLKTTPQARVFDTLVGTLEEMLQRRCPGCALACYREPKKVFTRELTSDVHPLERRPPRPSAAARKVKK